MCNHFPPPRGITNKTAGAEEKRELAQKSAICSTPRGVSVKNSRTFQTREEQYALNWQSCAREKKLRKSDRRGVRHCSALMPFSVSDFCLIRSGFKDARSEEPGSIRTESTYNDNKNLFPPLHAVKIPLRPVVFHLQEFHRHLRVKMKCFLRFDFPVGIGHWVLKAGMKFMTQWKLALRHRFLFWWLRVRKIILADAGIT